MSDRAFLESFSSALQALESDQIQSVEEQYANVFVLGLPRSGTTLLSQIIYHGTNCHCTNNFMARFWGTPLVGARLSRLTVDSAQPRRELDSFFGRTVGLDEPHEFSFYWHSMMGFSRGRDGLLDRIREPDWSRLAQTLLNLNRVFEAPLVHKPLELILQDLGALSSKFEKSIYIFIDRDAQQIAQSILNARIVRGNVNEWFGSEPEPAILRRMLTASPAEQIAFQIYYFREIYKKALMSLPVERKLIIKYEDLCADPNIFLRQLCEKSSSINGEIQASRILEPFAPSRRSMQTEVPEVLKEALQDKEIDGHLF